MRGRAAAGARPSVFMPQAVMSQVAQLSMWGRKRSRGVECLAGRADVSQQDAVQVVFVVVAVGQLRQECGRFGGSAQRACESAQLRNAAAQHPVGVDARREAGRKGCVAGVGQCEKVFGDGFH